MSRVLFYTGITILGVSFLLLYAPVFVLNTVIIMLCMLLAASLTFKKKLAVNGLRFLIILTLVFTVFGTYIRTGVVSDCEKLEGCSVQIVGTVVNYPQVKDNYTIYEIKSESVKILNGNAKRVPQNVKFRISDISKINANIFDKISFTADLNETEDYRVSSLSSGIYSAGRLEKYNGFIGKNRPFYAFLYDFRSKVNNLIYSKVNYNDSTVISALLLGDRMKLSDELNQNAKASGVSHMLVVSGMHLGILFQIFDIIFKKFRVSRKASSLLLMALVFAVSAICGFTPSIMRAGLTYFLIALGDFLFLKPDSLNSLGAAMVIIFFLNPFSAGNIALMLSLLSTFGLLFLCPVLVSFFNALLTRYKIKGFIIKPVILALCQTISATVFTLPVSVIVFGYVSVIAPLTNILAGYAVTAILALSILTVPLLLLPAAFQCIYALPLTVLCLLVRYFTGVVNLLGGISGAVVPLNIWYIVPVALILAAIFVYIVFGIYVMKNAKGIKIFKIISLLLAALSVVSVVVIDNTTYKNHLYVPDAGKGSAAVIYCEGKIIVVGSGDNENDAYKIKNYIFKLGKSKIDYLILPDLSKQFAAGTSKLEYLCNVKNVIFPADTESKYYKKIKYISNDDFHEYEKSFDFKLSNSLNIHGISGAGTVINSADRSIVIVSSTSKFSELEKTITGKTAVTVIGGKNNESFKYEKANTFILSGEDNYNLNITTVYKDRIYKTEKNIDYSF